MSTDNKTIPPTADSQSLQEWQDMKFGMFIHWGIYSQTAGYWNGQRAKCSGHIMLYEQIPVQEWGELAKDFNPVQFNADEWILAAKKAGMKYFVYTAKHHDALAMYDSPSSDYDLVDKSPFKRDPLKELADACHRHGLMLGIYYSLGRDWEDPNCPTNWPTKGGRSNTWDYPDEDGKVFNKYFERKVKPQVKELLTQYGKVGIMWFDTPHEISKEESAELRELILSLQPECIINSRIKHGYGDYEVREQQIGEINNTPWEACITMARHWNYDLDEDDQYKTPELLIHQLLEIVSKGGNYLLNNGPRPDGTMTENTLSRLKSIGEWMQINGEGVYGTRPMHVDHEPLSTSDVERVTGDELQGGIEAKDAVNDATSKVVPSEVRFTAKGKSVYAFISRWTKPTVKITSLSLERGEVADIALLGSDRKPVWSQSDEALTIECSEYYGTDDVPIRCLRIKMKESL